MNSINQIVKRLRENRILNEKEDYKNKSRNELIELAQEGDQLALETLISSHEDFIKMMSSKYHLDTGDRDDIVQVATIGFWEAVMSWNMSGNFEAYAGMIMKRKLTDEIRKDDTGKVKISTQAAQLDAPVGDDGEGGEMTLGATIAAQDDTAEAAIGNEVARGIMKFMEDNLSETERDVIKMYIAGYKVSEIAEETGMKYKKVENAVKRVKDKLAEYLKNSKNESKESVDESLEFTEEEKAILKNALHRLDLKYNIKESKGIDPDYSDYTEEQLDKVLEDIEEKVDLIIDDLKYTPYDDRDDMLDDLHDLDRHLIMNVEEWLVSDEQYDKYKEIRDRISRADNISYVDESVNV